MDPAAKSLPSSAPAIGASSPEPLTVFERYLRLWVGLCMVVGVVLGTCVHNAGRSQMAAAFFNKLADMFKARACPGTTSSDRGAPGSLSR